MNVHIKEPDAAVALGTIHQRMVGIGADLDAISKSQENKQQNFKYRGIDQVYKAINPLLSKYGVFMTAEVVGKTREERATKSGGVLAFTSLHMRYHFHASDGTSVMTEAEGEGMDSGDKSSNKAMAVAHKYALLQAFCVPTEDMPDPDAETHELGGAVQNGVIDKAQFATISKLLADTNSNVPVFCDLFKIEAVPDLPASQFKKAKDMLDKKAKKARTAAQADQVQS